MLHEFHVFVVLLRAEMNLKNEVVFTTLTWWQR